MKPLQSVQKLWSDETPKSPQLPSSRITPFAILS